jgi:hypothetical protein
MCSFHRSQRGSDKQNSHHVLNKLIGLKGKAFTYLLKQLPTRVVAKLLPSQVYQLLKPLLYL